VFPAALLVVVGAAMIANHRAEAAGPAASREEREADARRACAAARVEEGIEILAALLTQYGHPGYIYNQARCYQENGRAELAISRFREYLRAAPDSAPAVRTRVEGFIQELEAQLQRRAAPATAPAVGATASPPEPRVPAAQPESSSAPPGDEAPAAAGGAPASRAWRTAALVLGAVAVASAAGGVASSLEVRSLARQVEDARPGELTTSQLMDQQKQARTFERLQFLGYGVAALALAGAATCLVVHLHLDRTPPRERATMSVAPLVGAQGLAGAVVAVAF
jgi:hypothetical protein